MLPVSQKRVKNRESAELLDTGKCVYSARNSVWAFTHDFEQKYYSTRDTCSYREYFHDDFVMYQYLRMTYCRCNLATTTLYLEAHNVSTYAIL
jgi:hypothetical protein